MLAILQVLRIARAVRQGAYASVSGDEKTANPYPAGSIEARAWDKSWDEATEHRSKGLDPFGRAPARPHPCVRDATKICNCAVTSQYRCTLGQNAWRQKIARVLHVVADVIQGKRA